MIQLLLALFLTSKIFAADAKILVFCENKPAFTQNCKNTTSLSERSYDFVTHRIPDPVDRSQIPIQIEIKKLDVKGRTVIRNGREIIQISSDLPSIAAYQIVLVHELTHLIRHLYQPREVLWLDEGLAEFMGILFSNSREVTHEQKIRSSRYVFLSEHPEHYERHQLGYANAYFFMVYLYNRLGGESFLREVGTSPLAGWEAIAHAAKNLRAEGRIGIPEKYLSPAALFTHYAFATVFNDSTIAKYSLMSLDQNLLPLLNFEEPFSGEYEMPSAFVPSDEMLPALLQANSNCSVYSITGDYPLKIQKLKSSDPTANVKLLAVCL